MSQTVGQRLPQMIFGYRPKPLLPRLVINFIILFILIFISTQKDVTSFRHSCAMVIILPSISVTIGSDLVLSTLCYSIQLPPDGQ